MRLSAALMEPVEQTKKTKTRARDQVVVFIVVEHWIKSSPVDRICYINIFILVVVVRRIAFVFIVGNLVIMISVASHIGIVKFVSISADVV